MLKTKDGLELFTRNWKVADPKAIIVLTHGYNEHSGRYDHVGAAFNTAGYSLYAYDVRGHGRSGGQRGHTPSFTHLLDDLEIVLTDARQDAAPKDMAGKKVFIYGHSMGGNITLNYALRRPTGISGVMVTGPWLKLAFEPPALQLTIAKLIGKVAPGFSQKSGVNLPGLSRDEAVQAAYSADPLNHGLISIQLVLEITNNGLEALAQAPTLKMPVLLMHGGADPITSAKATEAFYQAAGSADKTFKTYPDFRHEIHNELGKEQVFADIVGVLEKA